MFKVAVGAVRLSPDSFYTSEIREVLLAIEGHKEDKEQDFLLNQIATTNAIGAFFGGKGFKMKDPFEEDINTTNSTTIEDKTETLEYLQSRFSN